MNMQPASANWYATPPSLPAEIIELGPPVRVTMSEPHSDWADAVKKRLTHICSLPAGWDGYAGRPTRFVTAHFAYELMRRICKPSTPPPSIVPLPSGGLQIEWHRANLDLELTVSGPNDVIAWLSESSDGDGEELSLTNDFSAILPWLDKLG